METTGERQVLPGETRVFSRRALIPVGGMLLVMLFSSFIYHNSWRIGNDTLHQFVADVSAALLFCSIGFGTLVVYPWTYRLGASTGARIIASLTVPIVWNFMEMFRVSEFFTFGETLYYGLNQVFLLAVFGSFAEMGICELYLRWRGNRIRDEKVSIITPAPLISIAVGLAAFYIIMIWGVGVHFFYWYGRIYRAIFF